MSTDNDLGGGGNTITDRQLFDSAVAPSPAPTSSPAPDPTPASAGTGPEAPPSQQPPEQQPRLDTGPQPRAPDGKFAPRTPQGQRQPEDHRVPLRELLDERDRRQRVEAEANEMRQAWTRLQQEQQQAQQPQTIFDAPDEYLDNRVMNPLRQEGYMMMLQVKDGLSREMANQQFGAAAVDAALTDLSGFRQTPQGNFVFQQIMSSAHPYGALVNWHKQASAQASIGSDPQAWLRKQQQAWFNDPKVQAAMINHVRAQQQQQGAGRSDVSLPPSLQSVGTGGRQEQGDLSSESLYAFATR